MGRPQNEKGRREVARLHGIREWSAQQSLLLGTLLTITFATTFLHRLVGNA